MTFNKSTRSYFFRAIVAEHLSNDRKSLPLARLRMMFKGATVAAIFKAEEAR